MTYKKVDSKLIQKLGSFSTSTLSDAMDKFGIDCGCKEIYPYSMGLKMAGIAYTVRYVPVGGVKGTVGDYIDEVNQDHVVVIDNNGRTDCTVWGDILTTAAKRKGIAGTLIDGVFRDADGVMELGYPIYSCGKFMMTGKERVMVESTQVTVNIGEVQVKPGDIIVGDGSGVVVIPCEMAEKVANAAEKIESAEQKIIQAVKEGLSIAEAREKYKYHDLQKG